MQKPKSIENKYFIPIGFSFVDSQHCDKQLWGAFPIYIAMRRYAWRANENGNQYFNVLIESNDDQIYCCIPLKKISQILGYTKGYVHKRIAILINAGWIKVSKYSFDRGQKIYALGARNKYREDNNKKYIMDIFYADVICENEMAERRKKIQE